jgi:hypothetical protein
MLKSIIMTGTALALSAAACILPPVCIDEALAQSAPRARGLQVPSGMADDVGEPALYVHMDVFERARERECPRFDFALDLSETLGDGVGVAGFDDAQAGEHGDMSLGACDVLAGELAVEVDRGVELLHDFGRAGREPAAPHRVAHECHPGSLD